MDGHDWSQTPQMQSMKHRGLQMNQSMPDLQKVGSSIIQQGNPKIFDLRQQEQQNRKLTYAEELKQQIEERKNKQLMDKQDGRVKDYEGLDDFYQYNPFGRGGGGAPLRDQNGQVITSRKPQMRNEFSRLHQFRKADDSVATRMKSRAHNRGQTGAVNKNEDLNQYISHLDQDFFGSQTGYDGGGPPPRTQGGGQNYLGVDLNKPTAAGIQNPDFQPDYYVAPPKPKPPPKEEPQPDYYVGAPEREKPAVVYDYSLWLSELLNLLYYERLMREDEDRRRRENMMIEEERLKREKEDLDWRYKKELADRQKEAERQQRDSLLQLQNFWEDIHHTEMQKWEDLMKTRPMVQYVERDDTLKLGQGLVDHLQKAIRTELDKIKANIDMQEVDLQGQINTLKTENFDADKERASTLIEIDQMNKILETQKNNDAIRSKYVYQTMLWDKMLDRKLFQGKSIKDKPELLDNRTQHLKKIEKDSYRLAREMEVPDRAKDRGFDGINLDKLNAQRLNEKNNERLTRFQQQMKQPEFELDYLEKQIKNSQMKFSDAKTLPSRYGGLSIGAHQSNYKSNRQLL